jgi:hypothetical protein
MNQSAIRLFVRSLITEAKEEKATKLPKSSGKLMDLKKELAALEQMKEEIQTAKFAEKTASTEVEFANLSKFAKELDKIKAGGVALEASIDAKIEELKGKIDTQKNKIKEMIGMTPTPGQEPMVDEKKEKPAMDAKKEKAPAKKAKVGDDKPKADKEAAKKKAELKEGQVIAIKKDFNLDGKEFKKGQTISTQPDFDTIEAAGKAGKIKQGEDFVMGIGGGGLREESHTNKTYSGMGQNRGDSGSSLEFKVIKNEDESIEIDYTIIPNSKNRQSGAGSKSPREKQSGTTKIMKSDIKNGNITVKGDSYSVGKNFLDQL